MKKLRLITNIVSLVLVIICGIIIAIKWESLPEMIPTHFGFRGEVTETGVKSILLGMFGVMFGMLVLIAVIERFPKFWNFPVRITEENKGRMIALGTVAIGITKVLMVCMFTVIILKCIFPSFPFWPMYLLTALLVAVVIWLIVQSIRLR